MIPPLQIGNMEFAFNLIQVELAAIFAALGGIYVVLLKHGGRLSRIEQFLRDKLKADL